MAPREFGESRGRLGGTIASTTRLNRLRRARVAFALMAAGLCRFALGQAVPAETPKLPLPVGEETIVLSPFEVSAATDHGYAARETLAGTRFKAELKDVPSQVSVMTKEFLEDIASVTVEDAYRYSLNVENTTEYTSPTNGGGDFSTGVLNTRAANRVRGLSSPGTTHDFFQTNLLQDTYNIERVNFSSGPNAILFGNGNPGGIVDGSFLRAHLQRARHEFSVRTDNYGSFRGAVDLNQPFFKDVLALRFAATNSRTTTWRAPGGRRDERYFGTVTVKPFKSTTVRAYLEDAMLDMTTPRNTRIGDYVTPWIAAGRPAFNNGLQNPTVINASNQGIFTRYTTTRPLLMLGNVDPATPYAVFGAGANANLALATTRYAAETLGPGSSPLQTGVDSYIYSLPYDESISRFDVDVNGNGTRNLMYGRIWGAAVEQRLPGDVYVQFDYNQERVRNPISDFLRGIASGIRADANLFLPDRVTPNPNYGKYYVEGQPRVLGYRSDSEEMRAMLSYELNLARRTGWQKWLGRHRMAALYQRNEAMSQQQEFVPRVIPAGTSPQTILENLGGPMFNTFAFRTYLSDPLDPRPGGTNHVTLPFDPVRTTTFMMPDGSTYVAGYRNPYGATASANLVNNLAEGQVLAVQSYFLRDRLVASFGWRKDHIRQATYVTQRKTATPNGAFESMFELDAPTNWSDFTQGSTNTQGAVLHVLPWLSVFYNQSSTWNPPTGLINPDTGTQVPGGTGDGRDYGFMLRLFSERLSLRVNRYRNTSGPASDTGFRNAIIPVVQNIERTLNDHLDAGTINVPRPRYYDAEQGTYTLSGLFSDLVSEGYEVELVANLTRNWRISLTGAKAESTASNIGRPWINFIQERSATWAANANLAGPDNSNTTIGTRYLSIIQTLNQMKQADGQKVENGRDWRVNLVTRYTMAEGALRGSFVGTGFRYRSSQVLGYLAQMVPNEFPLPGAPAQVLVPARNAPITGETLKDTELFLGYSRRFKQCNWRLQLNVRNLFDDHDPVAQRANIAAGFTTVYAVPEPRSFVLTNSITF